MLLLKLNAPSVAVCTVMLFSNLLFAASSALFETLPLLLVVISSGITSILLEVVLKYSTASSKKFIFAQRLQGQLLPNSSGAPLLKHKLLAFNPETLQK